METTPSILLHVIEIHQRDGKLKEKVNEPQFFILHDQQRFITKKIILSDSENEETYTVCRVYGSGGVTEYIVSESMEEIDAKILAATKSVHDFTQLYKEIQELRETISTGFAKLAETIAAPPVMILITKTSDLCQILINANDFDFTETSDISGNKYTLLTNKKTQETFMALEKITEIYRRLKETK